MSESGLYAESEDFPGGVGKFSESWAAEFASSSSVKSCGEISAGKPGGGLAVESLERSIGGTSATLAEANFLVFLGMEFFGFKIGDGGRILGQVFR